MPIRSVATKPDGEGGVWTLYWHEDGPAELWHRPAGRMVHCLIGRQIMYRLQAAMAERGITEDSWMPA
jgi:hypothetical protein